MRPNAWVGLVAVVLGAVYAYQSWALPRAPIGNPLAPVMFPLGLGLLMMLLGAITFATEAAKGLNSDDKAKRPQFHLKGMKLIFFVIFMCLVYTVLFDHAGFVFSTLIFLMCMLSVINAGRFKQNLVVTLAFSFGLWYIFQSVFQINLPASPLGIL